MRQLAVAMMLCLMSLCAFAKTEQEALEAWNRLIDSGNRAMDSKNYEEAERFYRLAFDEIKEFGLTPALAGTFTNMGRVSRATGRLDKAEQYFTNAVGISQKTRGNFHRETAMDLHNLASVELDLQKYDLADQHMSVALRIMSELGLRQDPATAAMIDLWARILDKKGKPESAAKLRGLLESPKQNN